MIRERINAGLARARAKGACALGRRPTSSKVEQRIRDLRGAGMGILKIARQFGVGVSPVVQWSPSPRRHNKGTHRFTKRGWIVSSPGSHRIAVK
jgi:DNA invertase Pin-like site-specific DNA recombinase